MSLAENMELGEKTRQLVREFVVTVEDREWGVGCRWYRKKLLLDC